MFKKIMLTIVLTIVAVIFVNLTYLYFKQESIIFLPSTDYDEKINYLGAEEVVLTTEDGVRLHGLYKEVDAEADYVLFFHGNQGNVSNLAWQLNFFESLSLNYFAIDYRSYGRSEGIISQEEQVYMDAETAWQYLNREKKVKAENIIIWGHSLGGSVSIDLASNKKEKAVIVESSFASMREMKNKYYPYVPDFLLKYKMDSDKKIGKIDSPVMIVHSPQDEMIDIKNAKVLFEKAKEPKKFAEIGGGHNEGMITSGDVYRDCIKDFLDLEK